MARHNLDNGPAPKRRRRLLPGFRRVGNSNALERIPIRSPSPPLQSDQEDAHSRQSEDERGPDEEEEAEDTTAEEPASPAESPADDSNDLEEMQVINRSLREAKIRHPGRLIQQAREIRLPDADINAYILRIKRANDQLARQLKSHRRATLGPP